MRARRNSRILFIIAFAFTFARTGYSFECGSVPTYEQRALYRELLNEVRRSSVSLDDLAEIPLTVHIIRETDGTGGISLEDVDACIAQLNTDYLPFDFHFYRLCDAIYIDNSYFYELNNFAHRNQLRNTQFVPFTINVYFASRLNTSGSLLGESPFPGMSPQGILLKNIVGQEPDMRAAFTHEMGHYFNLFHTHEDCVDEDGNRMHCLVDQLERVVRPEDANEDDFVNCWSTADELCDTDADPFFAGGMNGNCEWDGNGFDCAQSNPCRDLDGRIYTPPLTNFMSYAPTTCMSLFSPSQVQVAISAYNILRTELHNYDWGQGSRLPSAFAACRDLNGLQAAQPVGLVTQESNGEIQMVREADGGCGAIMLLDGETIAHFVHGAIYAHYRSVLGGSAGVLGFPISDEGEAYSSPYGTQGRYTRFEHGTINYISSSTNPNLDPDIIGRSFAIYGPIWSAFQVFGYSGWNGFPTSDIENIGQSQRMWVEDGYYYSYNGQAALYFAGTSPVQLYANVAYDHLHLHWVDRAWTETRQWVRKRVFSGTLTEGDTVFEVGTNVTSFDDFAVSAGTGYLYEVIALADTVQSPPSNPAYALFSTDSLDRYLVAAEYFFNADPGFGSGTIIAFPPTKTPQLSDAIQMEFVALPPGFHILYLRYRDSRGVWSAAEGRSFYVTPPLPQGVQTITHAEMFYDNDPGTGNGDDLPVFANYDVTLATAAAVSSLSSGFHRAYLRYRTNSGTWSAAEGRSFFVTPPVLTGVQTISSAEYYYDSDPGQGQATEIEIEDASDIVLTRALSTVDVAPGFHRLYLRYLTNSNAWSASEGRSLYVTPAISESLFIAGGEIFLDSVGSPGEGLALIADDGNFEESHEDMHRNMPVSALSIGQHYVLARVQDSRGLWSNVVRDSFAVAVPENIELVAQSDSLGQSVRLIWTTFPGAMEYHVHHDSSATGSFADFVTVVAPDTSVLLATMPGQGLRFYQVVAILPSRATGREDGVALPDSYSLSTKQPILPGPVALPQLEKDSLKKH